MLEPLAARLRPVLIENFFGQQHLLAVGKPLRASLQQGKLHSMIFWGPPGTGKTTLARIIAQQAHAHVESISAVFAGVKDIRAAVTDAQQRSGATVLFVDEVHRFNKSQQDAFLPFVEDGTLTFIGATTENPSFSLNNALLSRAKVYVLKSLSEPDLLQLIARGIAELEKEYKQPITFPTALQTQLATAADGDARRCLNFLEITVQLASSTAEKLLINQTLLAQVLTDNTRRFDNRGDIFYEQISALHKAVRGSSPDAALYWLARMLDGGCDPLYIARRVVRMANEDIGNADPRGLQLALTAWEIYERLGSPEGELAIAQAITYLAATAKSNAVYTAFKQAMSDAKNYGSLPVPKHLCNAPTKLMKDMGYAKNYRYAHDEQAAYAAGENYFPEGMPQKTYYQPVQRGLEIKIGEKLAKLRQLDK